MGKSAATGGGEPADPPRGGEYLDRVRARGPIYDAAGLEAVEDVGAADAPAEDKWTTT